jgi:hypothetical protein
MNAVSRPADTQVLCVTRWEGRAVEWPFAMPEGTEQTDLARIWHELGLPSDPHPEAELCVFHKPNHANDQAWAFEHRCEELRCGLNGRQVPHGQRVWLHADDVLDIGLCRLGLQNPQRLGAAQQSAATANTDDVAAWDLTTLAHGAMADPLKPADAFDDLLGSTSLQEDAAMSVAPSQQWPQTPPQPPAQTPATQQALLPSSEAGTSSSAEWPVWQAKVIPDGLAEPAQEQALDQWHALYIRRLQAPHENSTESAWVGLTEQHAGARVDAMSSLMTRAEKGPDLSSLLGESEHISSVLSRLDDPKDPDWLAATETVNVLHLFAPHNWQAPTSPTDVPLISRQEHHGMAIDSAVSLSSTPPAPSRDQTP